MDERVTGQKKPDDLAAGEELAQAVMESVRESVQRVEAFFKKGTLEGKEREATALREKGDTLFFDGRVYWGITIPYDRVFNGESESLDHAMQDIRNALLWLREDIYKGDGETEVICYIKPGPGNNGGVHE